MMHTTSPSAYFAALAITLAATTLSLGGCSTLMAVPKQQELANANAFVSGTVTTENYAARGPLIVGLLARRGQADDPSDFFLVGHFVADKPGPFVFAVKPGKYYLAAFEDVNRDNVYDDEPALRVDPVHPLEVAAGEHRKDITLSIPLQGRFREKKFALADLTARTPAEQQLVSLLDRCVNGKVTTLANPDFAPEVGEMGMWKFYDFLIKDQPGIYFLQEYDPKKIPVLLVHGIKGTPRDFTAVIDSLDRTRFQPWVFYYPSGAYLDRIAGALTQLFVRLQLQYGFDRAIVVAHSMGGLVTRQFVLQFDETSGSKVIRTYVTISSPLGGMASAGEGVEHLPSGYVIRSWEGLAPGSKFLDGLFYTDPPKNSKRRRLPEHIAYHMLFGFQGSSGDGTVAISSQLRAEAQEEARSERGFNETHMGILQYPPALHHLNEILAAVQ